MKIYLFQKKNLRRLGLWILFVFVAFFSTGSQAEESGYTYNDIFKGLSGGQVFNVSVMDSILAALENNPTVAIQRLDPLMASASVQEERAAFDPEVSASVSQSKIESEAQLGTRVEPLGLTTKRSSQSLGISETLPTGTTLSLSASVDGSISSLYTDQYTGDIEFSLTQSLLQGFGTKTNLAALRKARIDVDISNLELTAVAEDLVAQVEKAYWELYLSKEQISINEESLALAERQQEETKERVAVGDLAEIELASVNAEVAARRESLIDAQTAYEAARLQFLYLLNPQEPDMWNITPEAMDKPFMPEDAMDSINVHVELGLKYRSDLQQARLSLEQGELEVQQTKNGLLPKLNFFLTYGKSSYAESFGDAYPDPGSKFSHYSTGLSFSMPLSNRSAKAKYEKNLRSMEQMELSVKNMERLVALDVRSAYIEAVKSREMIEATRVTRELQQINMDAELEKFRVGKSTNILVLQAQRDFTEAMLDESESMINYLNALIDLYVAQGTLLERRGIEGFTDS